MLELQHISKTYEGSQLLVDISFSVKKGETVCLLGVSGSGKSTLLRMIAGVEAPDEGRILFHHTDLASFPPHLRDFGLVFQDYGLFPHLNVFDNIAFGLRMKRMPPEEIHPRVASLLLQVNLMGFENRKVTDLSGGEQQRVALARALAPRPRLLMFDEPLGALDRSLKEELLNELRAVLHAAKIPAIYVTHDQEEAFAIADRILLLHGGRIVRAGTPSEIWSHPGSAWAANFLGIGNVIEGVMVSVNKVRTEFGIFGINCRHGHRRGDPIRLWLKQSRSAEEKVKLRVEDVRFNREQYEVRAQGGLAFQSKTRPVLGEVIFMRVKLECLE